MNREYIGGNDYGDRSILRQNVKTLLLQEVWVGDLFCGHAMGPSSTVRRIAKEHHGGKRVRTVTLWEVDRKTRKEVT